MDQLRIRVFGSLEVRREGALLPAFPTQGSGGLFAYLVLKRDRLIHRDVLCGEFWGNQPESDARKALRTALWRIRTVVEPSKKQRGTCLLVDGQHVGLARTEGIWVDVWEFEDSLNLTGPRGLVEPAPEQLERARLLYRGDFLEGFYDRWTLLHRDRLQLAYLTALERLVSHYSHDRDWLEAIACAQQVLRIDPLREHIHRAVMEAHLAMGDRPSAVRQYHACARSLKDDLEIEPMQETKDLYERIRRDATDPRSGSPEPAVTEREFHPIGRFAAEVDGALRELHALTRRLERAREALPSPDEYHMPGRDPAFEAS